LGISRSGYYKWKASGNTPEYKQDVLIKELVSETHKKYPMYGTLRIQKYLEVNNHKYNKNTIHRYMKLLGIKSKVRVKKYKRWTKETHSNRFFRDYIKRDFHAEAPNQKWSTDITYLPFGGGRLYLVAIIDLFDNSIVSYKISNNMEVEFVLDCLTEAVLKNNIQPNTLILHSDRGIHFSCNKYKQLLKKLKIKGSHSRLGNCWDNVCIESFFSNLKEEGVRLNKPNSKSAMISCVDNYIDFYNNERISLKWNGMTNAKKRSEYFFASDIINSLSA
jgi:putative transposase